MQVELSYGTGGLMVDLPESTVVVRPAHHEPMAPASELVRASLARPIGSPRLGDLVEKGDRVAIAVCDGTRPQPRAVMLEAIFAELAGRVPDRDVVVIVATGAHRASTKEELVAMFSPAILERVEVVDHDAFEGHGLVELAPAGHDVPVVVNRRFVEADVRITTGFVEPHFFAGFSGGPKLVAPGLAGIATILALHDARHIGHESASFGVLEGNPVHEDVRAVAEAVGVHFSCDVILNKAQQVVACFSGAMGAMHAVACRASAATAMQAVPSRFDVVVTTNAGFPLDQNLYQAVKGMAAAARVVRPGGLILAAARCVDGFPDGGSFRQLVTSTPSPAALLELIEAGGDTVLDQWQAQVLARIQRLARVGVYSEGIRPEDLLTAHLEPVADLSAAVCDELSRAGEGATICCLPEGPQTIPFVAPNVPGSLPGSAGSGML